MNDRPPPSDPTGVTAGDGSPVVMFFPYGLLHKYGFDDGDILLELNADLEFDLDHHDLLIAVVERLLIPRLDQDVDTYTIWATLHNPIRAQMIDGQEPDMDSTLTPEVVEISVADILQVARQLAATAAGGRPT